MAGAIPGGDIARRSKILHGIAEARKRESYESQKGKLLRVLFEERLESGHFVGFSDQYVKVGVMTPVDLSNRLGVARVKGVFQPGRGSRGPLFAEGEILHIEEAGHIARDEQAGDTACIENKDRSPLRRDVLLRPGRRARQGVSEETGFDLTSDLTWE
jgi:hypothetical protein